MKICVGDGGFFFNYLDPINKTSNYLKRLFSRAGKSIGIAYKSSSVELLASVLCGITNINSGF